MTLKELEERKRVFDEIIRALLLKYHPDQYAGDPQISNEITLLILDAKEKMERVYRRVKAL